LLLAAFDRAGDLNPGGFVGDTNRAGDLIDVLPAGAAGATKATMSKSTSGISISVSLSSKSGTTSTDAKLVCRCSAH